MNAVQFRTGRRLTSEVNDFLLNKSEDVFELLDKIQLAYNDDRLCESDYVALVQLLEPFVYEDSIASV